jgi:hypothetical protein
MRFQGLYNELNVAASVSALLASPAKSSIFISVAVKHANQLFLVMNLVAAAPTKASLDGISGLTDGEIQFDIYARRARAAGTRWRG